MVLVSIILKMMMKIGFLWCDVMVGVCVLVFYLLLGVRLVGLIVIGVKFGLSGRLRIIKIFSIDIEMIKIVME